MNADGINNTGLLKILPRKLQHSGSNVYADCLFRDARHWYQKPTDAAAKVQRSSRSVFRIDVTLHEANHISDKFLATPKKQFPLFWSHNSSFSTKLLIAEHSPIGILVRDEGPVFIRYLACFHLPSKIDPTSRRGSSLPDAQLGDSAEQPAESAVIPTRSQHPTALGARQRPSLFQVIARMQAVQ